MRQHPLGIYEKALPKTLTWPERLVLAKSCGFDFVEMSVDETDERLSRLEWSTTQRASLVEAMLETGVSIPSMCLSAHRRFPFGSRDETVRERAREIMPASLPAPEGAVIYRGFAEWPRPSRRYPRSRRPARRPRWPWASRRPRRWNRTGPTPGRPWP